MPYFDEQSVRDLCINVRSGLTLGEMTAAAKLYEAMIDAKIGEYYYWPKDSSGNVISTVPPLIVEISNLYVAYRIESRKFAQNEAGGSFVNPYATKLKKDADDAMKDITEGDMEVDGLERRAMVSSSPTATIFQIPGSRGSSLFDRRGRSRGRC